MTRYLVTISPADATIGRAPIGWVVEWTAAESALEAVKNVAAAAGLRIVRGVAPATDGPVTRFTVERHSGIGWGTAAVSVDRHPHI